MEDDIYFHPEYKMWWPKFDHKPAGNHHMMQSGIGAIDILLKYCGTRRVCIQAGGHLGYWPLRLTEEFDQVHTFEPDPIVFECLRRNIEAANLAQCYTAIEAYKSALGARPNTITMRRGSSAGSTRFWPDGKLQVNQVTLDSLFDRCDALILDIEGYEIEALKGGQYLINECRPVILVEELPNNKEALYEYMKDIGYFRRAGYGKDGIWTSR